MRTGAIVKISGILQCGCSQIPKQHFCILGGTIRLSCAHIVPISASESTELLRCINLSIIIIIIIITAYRNQFYLKPMVPMESRDSEGVPFASLESQ